MYNNMYIYFGFDVVCFLELHCENVEKIVHFRNHGKVHKYRIAEDTDGTLFVEVCNTYI